MDTSVWLVLAIVVAISAGYWFPVAARLFKHKKKHIAMVRPRKGSRRKVHEATSPEPGKEASGLSADGV